MASKSSRVFSVRDFRASGAMAGEYPGVSHHAEKDLVDALVNRGGRRALDQLRGRVMPKLKFTARSRPGRKSSGLKGTAPPPSSIKTPKAGVVARAMAAHSKPKRSYNPIGNLQDYAYTKKRKRK
jgi:hypothetical protein